MPIKLYRLACLAGVYAVRVQCNVVCVVYACWSGQSISGAARQYMGVHVKACMLVCEA